MRVVTSYDGVLQELSRAEAEGRAEGGARFTTGVEGWDAVLAGGWAEADGGGGSAVSGATETVLGSVRALGSVGSGSESAGLVGGWGGGGVHELLYSAESVPMLPALLVARGMVRADEASGRKGKLVWIDSGAELFMPAVIAAGVPAERVVAVRPRTLADEWWTIAECLRCPAVAAVVGRVGALTRVWARRFQLSAERGGGVGVLMRPEAKAGVHAALTRWRVTPTAGARTVQRWDVELLSARGGAGRVGGRVRLEVDREADSVRAVAVVADRAEKATWRRGVG